ERLYPGGENRPAEIAITGTRLGRDYSGLRNNCCCHFAGRERSRRRCPPQLPTGYLGFGRTAAPLCRLRVCTRGSAVVTFLPAGRSVLVTPSLMVRLPSRATISTFSPLSVTSNFAF